MSRTGRGRDEKGAVLPLVGITLVVVLLAAGFTIDLGSAAAATRRLQAQADLITLDATAELNGSSCGTLYAKPGEVVPSSLFDHIRAAAVASARRNRVTDLTKLSVTAIKLTRLPTGKAQRDAQGRPVMTPIPTCGDVGDPNVPDAVRVSITERVSFGFSRVVGFTGLDPTRTSNAYRAPRLTPGGTTPTTAPGGDPRKQEPMGSFTLASSVATLDSKSATTLNELLTVALCSAYRVNTSSPGGPTGATDPVFAATGGGSTVGPLLGACKVGFSLVGYRGLASVGVDLGDVATNLGLGSTNALMNNKTNVGQLLVAAASAADCSGQDASCSTGKTQLAALGAVLASNSTAKASVGDIVKLNEDGTAATTRISLLDLLTGAAKVVDGQHFFSMGSSTTDVANVSNTRLTVDAVEGPVKYSGTLGGAVDTAQTRLTFEADAALPVVVRSVDALGVTVSVPSTLTTRVRIAVKGGAARGVLSALRCQAPDKGVDVTVTIAAVTPTAQLGNTVVTVLGVPITMNVTVSNAPTGASTQLVGFRHPTEYQDHGGGTKHVGGTNLGISSSTVSASVSGTGSPVTGVNAGATAATQAAIGSLVGTVVSTVFAPLNSALGLDIGSAEVGATDPLSCGVPTLVG